MEETPRALDVLGDPTRRAIVDRLRRGPSPVGLLAEGMPVSRPAVSQHLTVLKTAGLVSEHREGTRRIYQLERAGFEELRRWVEAVAVDARAGRDRTMPVEVPAPDAAGPRVDREGTRRIYQLERAGFEELRRWVEALAVDARAGRDRTMPVEVPAPDAVGASGRGPATKAGRSAAKDASGKKKHGKKRPGKK
jgi:DNA-binding transcriptional ArsR family regulator